MPFYTSPQSHNKSEFLIYAFFKKDINKSGYRCKVPTSLNIIKVMLAS